jgi:3-dehydroquinate dehydratase-2
MAANEDGFEDVLPTVTLAKLYEKQGLLDDAALVYRKLLSIEPGQQALEDALDALEKKRQRSKSRTKSNEAEAVLLQLEKWGTAVSLRKKHLEKGDMTTAKVLIVCASPIDSPGPSERTDGQANATSRDIENHIKRAAEESAMAADVFWVSNEAELIERLKGAVGGYDAVIINPGNPPFTGTDTREVLAVFDIPIIEVHPLNTAFEGFTAQSGIADLATAHLAGFGMEGYVMAVRAAAMMTRQAFAAKPLAEKNVP